MRPPCPLENPAALLINFPQTAGCLIPHLIIGSSMGTIMVVGTAFFYKRRDQPEKNDLVKPNGPDRKNLNQSESNGRVQKNNKDPRKDSTN